MLKEEARPSGLTARGRARRTASVASTRQHDSNIRDREVCILIRKRNKLCNINKLVVARPVGELVLASVYRNRKAVTHVSVPPSVLVFARKNCCKRWIVRIEADCRADCYSLDLSQVEKVAYLKRSEDRAEYFVPLARFKQTHWQAWNYVERTILLEDEKEQDSKQLALL